MMFKDKVLALNAMLASQPMIQEGTKPAPAGDNYKDPKSKSGEETTRAPSTNEER